MLRLSFVTAALLLTSCVAKTNATVTRIDGGAFRACFLSLGWTEEETVKECGEPDARLRSLNEDETGCLLYSTRTLVAFAGVTVPNNAQLAQYVACFRPTLRKKGGVLTTVWAISKDGARVNVETATVPSAPSAPLPAILPMPGQ